MLRFGVLGSGSGGNCAVLQSGAGAVLIDAGLSARQIGLRLEILGISPECLTAILLTHEHGDHVSGLDVFCRKHDLPIYCNSLTREVLISGCVKRPKTWRVVETGSSFAIGDLSIQTFPVAHDATDPVGMVVEHTATAARVGILSDVGYVTHLMREQVRDVDLLFVESNYDEVMLQNDTRRPWATKQRIVSRHGHLSNEQTAAFVGEVAGPRLQSIVLGHLSRDCNTPAVAVETVTGVLREAGRPDLPVTCALQDEPLPLAEIKPPSFPPAERVRETAPPARWQQAELFPAP